jgi:tetratricopeptide (TPR) repeat protein
VYRAVLVVSAALACACQPTPSSPSAPAPTFSDDDRRVMARALCLDPSLDAQPGTQALDRVASRDWVAIGEAWIDKARRTYDEGLYLHAGACAELATRDDPRDLAAALLRGQVQLNRHDFAKARATAERVVAERPRDQRAWGLLSDAALELGDLPAAVQAAQRMVDLKPNLPSYARAAHLAWLQSDVAAAKLYYRQAYKAAGAGEPRAWILVEAAEIFRLEGDLAGADAGFALALENHPDYPPALVGRARVAIARGDAERARDLVARARSLNPHVDTRGIEEASHVAL